MCSKLHQEAFLRFIVSFAKSPWAFASELVKFLMRMDHGSDDSPECPILLILIFIVVWFLPVNICRRRRKTGKADPQSEGSLRHSMIGVTCVG